MKLSQAGELRLIRSIRKKFAGTRPPVCQGIGDDAAVVRSHTPGGMDLLLTTDVQVEGVDFDLRYCPFHQIGFKALAANLSDIAAMGGIPRFSLVTLGLSRHLTTDLVDELFSGMADLADAYQVQLIGGDVSATPGAMFAGVTIIGAVPRGRAVLRSGARVGDQIFVTGTLGDAAAGLELARSGRFGSTSQLQLIQRQFYPIPRVREGRLLAGKGMASAMIDLSDGLATDLRHLCDESRVGAEIEAEAVPLSGPLREHARKNKKNPLQYALTGGEDFELLFTVPKNRGTRLSRLAAREAVRITRIGRVLPRSQGIRLLDARNRIRPLPKRGYEHFF